MEDKTGGTKKWSRSEIIALLSLLVALADVMASGIFVPELRSLGEQIVRKFSSSTSANSQAIVGVQCRMLTENARKYHNLPDFQGGVEIIKVDPASPADRSGLQVGDVIRRVDGIILKSTIDLRERIGRAKPGQPLQFEVWRDGRPLDATITPVNGFNFYEEACNKGEAEGCLYLGNLYAGLKQSLDKQQAFPLFTKSCGMGSAVACFNQALAYSDGVGVEKDPARAIALLEKYCDGKYFDSCSKLGYYYETSKGTDRDIIKASDLYKKSCYGGSLLGCSKWGALFRDGIGVEKDPMQAARLFGRACDGGLALGCSLLGELYQQGIGVSRDTVRAAKLHTQACSEGESASCQNLATLLEAGDGVPKDMAQAKALYDKACSEDQRWSCFKLGLLFSQDGLDKNFSQALSFHQRGCQLGEPQACNKQGEMYEYGQGVEVDKVKAANLYEGACDSVALACASRGRLAAEAGDTAKAETFFNKACEKNLGQGCAQLADFYETQKRLLNAGLARLRAIGAYQKECDSGNYSSCTAGKAGTRKP